jgi:hypothetical protein
VQVSMTIIVSEAALALSATWAHVLGNLLDVLQGGRVPCHWRCWPRQGQGSPVVQARAFPGARCTHGTLSPFCSVVSVLCIIV